MQMQFSLHTTDEARRKELVPTKTLTFKEMGRYGEQFWSPGDKRLTLNFATPKGYPLEPKRLLEHFDPERFLIKLTPVNPTVRSAQAGLSGRIDPNQPGENQALCDSFTQAGYDVILSIGELMENQIGSNCGMFIQRTN